MIAAEVFQRGPNKKKNKRKPLKKKEIIPLKDIYKQYTAKK